MNKNLKKESIDFVARYYRPGAFNAKKAWKSLGIIIPWYARTSVKHIMWSAAAVAVLLAVGTYYFVFPEDYTRLVAENSELSASLPDGSTITLYPGSSLEYKVASFASNRNVTLSGKAFFAVARNEDAAFKVYAGNTEVEVLGTKFIVNQAKTDSVVVSVESGKVRVTNQSGEECVITAGMEAVSVPESLSVTSAIINIDIQDTSLQSLAQIIEDRYGYQLINLPVTSENITLSYKGDAQGLIEIINDMFDSEISLK